LGKNQQFAIKKQQSSLLNINIAVFILYCPVDEAIWVRIDSVENSFVAALGNTHGQESDTRRVKFQYYPF
jgi:hypothetical protein